MIGAPLREPTRSSKLRPQAAVCQNERHIAEADVIRNVHGIAEAAGLDGDEVGLLLGKIADIKSVN